PKCSPLPHFRATSARFRPKLLMLGFSGIQGPGVAERRLGGPKPQVSPILGKPNFKKEESPMRNLKRALSLALASVMVLGLMVVGSGASYADVTSEENQEAIEVLQAVGVMVGDDEGNFNPDKNVTSNEMAIVMSSLLDLHVEDVYAADIPFTDVPSWAVAYVASCYADGITSGTSATTYGGSNTVTAAQAALMMMKALGYFQY